MLVLTIDNLEELKDKVLETCWKSGLEATLWGKNPDTGEICGLKIVFTNGAEIYIGSKDQSLIYIEVVNPNGFVQRNIKRAEEEESSTC